ncbi:Regulatory protein AtoC [Koleobacter methoxysyntrophicus]|jgi:transcriptional regulator with PAS, ATPase and Fis domain|uniref:Regulatory protein AtoC n=1 Tax=Koleobacter methoxysyntrophicus TaxID=2751313 RepID=A0A8A0RPU3_9FIRM|nr:sigma 54-interacting transcriptional regulator [Koleobacter methoxysyntrophicus]QSQ09226.1 Regulatory protein AtoC [Koleobacter methoxysyntrophicus]
MNEKIIHVLSIDKKVNNFLVKTLKDIIGDKLHVVGFCFEEGVKGPKSAPLVLISGKFLYERARKVYPYSKIISAKRTINGSNLEKLFILPKGKKVLVINHPKETTIETICSLEEMGINHLEYIPYWRGSGIDIRDIDTAISPGMIHLCPEEIKNKIDIGSRPIAFSTFAEIMIYFGLNIEFIDKFAYEYGRRLVNAGQKISEAYQRAEGLRKNLQSIFAEIDDAIVSVDEHNRISEFNPVAEKLLGFSKKEIIGNKVDSVFKDIEGFSSLIADKEKKDKLLNLNEKRILCSYIPLSKESGESYIITFKEVSKIQKLEENIRRVLYKKGFVAKYTFDDIAGNSEAIKNTISKAQKIAKSNSTVLIIGESGTGKELFAQAIHNESSRKPRPFVAVNFAALPENLVESELFGYEEGAFTGAKKGGKEGLFEQAHGGTIFLDEIGDASLSIQARLLRVLQEKEVMRLGATKILPVDVRVIAATNKDLKQLVEKGLFREDLYYRLRVLPLTLPPLRERKEDIPVLAEIFMKKYGISKRLSKEAQYCMDKYNWPGNVRELENVMEYVANISEGDIIQVEDLPLDVNNISIKDRGSNGDRDIKLLIEKLDCLFNLKDVEFILEVLKGYKDKNIRIGRRKLADLARLKGMELTEEKIRTLLKNLQQYGLVLRGRTRQGTVLTKKGETILGYIRGE